MSYFKKEELLDWLDEAHGSDCLDDALSKEHSRVGQTPEFWSEKARIRDQAYQQIKEMIQKEAERDEIEARYIDIVIDLYDQLEKKKPQVTEEFVEKWVNIIRPETPTSIRIALKDMLKEAGVEVVGK